MRTPLVDSRCTTPRTKLSQWIARLPGVPGVSPNTGQSNGLHSAPPGPGEGEERGEGPAHLSVTQAER